MGWGWELRVRGWGTRHGNHPCTRIIEECGMCSAGGMLEETTKDKLITPFIKNKKWFRILGSALKDSLKMFTNILCFEGPGTEVVWEAREHVTLSQY